MDDGVTEDEYNDLKKEGQKISDEMKAKRDAMAEMYGWTTDEDSEREASKRVCFHVTRFCRRIEW